jgi:hypothetical protein
VILDELGLVNEPVDWTLKAAKKLAFSFPTPLHKSFQIACSELERLQAEIHRLRGRLSRYEVVEPWSDI